MAPRPGELSRGRRGQPFDRASERGTRLNELARQIVDNFADYVEGSDLLTAIDQKEFADVQIKAPLSKALRELEKTLA